MTHIPKSSLTPRREYIEWKMEVPSKTEVLGAFLVLFPVSLILAGSKQVQFLFKSPYDYFLFLALTLLVIVLHEGVHILVIRALGLGFRVGFGGYYVYLTIKGEMGKWRFFLIAISPLLISFLPFVFPGWPVLRVIAFLNFLGSVGDILILMKLLGVGRARIMDEGRFMVVLSEKPPKTSILVENFFSSFPLFMLVSLLITLMVLIRVGGSAEAYLVPDRTYFLATDFSLVYSILTLFSKNGEVHF